MKTLSLIAAAVALTAASTANAGFVVYSNASAFAAAAGSLHNETFASAPLSGVTTTNYSRVYSDFTLSSVSHGNYSGIVNNVYNGDNYAPASGFTGQNFYGWGSSAGNQGPTSTFTLTGATAIGFDFFNTDTTDNYLISVNGIDRGGIGYFTSGFFGVIATGGDVISQLQIRTNSFGGYVSSAGVDNVRVAAHALPEPSALLLTAGALLAVAGVSRRKNAR